MPPLIGVLGIKFYCRPSVRMYLPPIIFRQLKLCNCLWERFEIWYIASALFKSIALNRVSHFSRDFKLHFCKFERNSNVFCKIEWTEFTGNFCLFRIFISNTVLSSALIWKITIFNCFPIIAIFVRGSSYLLKLLNVMIVF